jgi:hypothetical protein
MRSPKALTASAKNCARSLSSKGANETDAIDHDGFANLENSG